MDYLRRTINNGHGDGEHDVCDQQTTRSRTFAAQEVETQSPTSIANKVLATSFLTTPTGQQLAFLPDFTEHPKPKRRPRTPTTPPPAQDSPPPTAGSGDDDDKTPTEEIAFRHDFLAGGVAGCASVIVGHPFDT